MFKMSLQLLKYIYTFGVAVHVSLGRVTCCRLRNLVYFEKRRAFLERLMTLLYFPHSFWANGGATHPDTSFINIFTFIIRNNYISIAVDKIFKQIIKQQRKAKIATRAQLFY
jgi:hypothetical protein